MEAKLLHEIEELLNNDLIPYQEAIKNNADMIMISHLALPKITKDYTPASLSYEIITNLLKKKLGFKGLVVTDALNMQALTKNYSEKEILIKAINAGADLLLMPEDPVNAVKIIKEALNEGLISGIGSNIFKLAGNVILYGVVSVYIFGVVRLLIFGG